MPILAALYLASLAVLSIVSESARLCLLASVCTSVMTIYVYWKDKSASVYENWRIPESSLNLLALAGGWPGAAAAQTLFRHKTKKIGFRVVYIVASFANIALNAFVIAWVWPK